MDVQRVETTKLAQANLCDHASDIDWMPRRVKPSPKMLFLLVVAATGEQGQEMPDKIPQRG
jgi:hypothetical protein